MKEHFKNSEHNSICPSLKASLYSLDAPPFSIHHSSRDSSSDSEYLKISCVRMMFMNHGHKLEHCYLPNVYS